MEIFALVGPSGTGKSHRAQNVAHEYQIDTIIDDGLLISGSKIIAGTSAKKEASKIKAVRRAIFTDPEHAKQVSEAISVLRPAKILILGTSENMVAKIVAVLQLPVVSRFIHIEEIATPTEIAIARKVRTKEGKHIIPVPSIELKPHFSGFLIDPLENFFKKERRKRRLGEKSIVRPTFSYCGKLLISDSVIAAIVEHVALNVTGLAKTSNINIRNANDKEKGISIALDVTIRYGVQIFAVVQQAQQQIKQMVESMTGMMVKEVNIAVKSLSIE